MTIIFSLFLSGRKKAKQFNTDPSYKPTLANYMRQGTHIPADALDGGRGRGSEPRGERILFTILLFFGRLKNAICKRLYAIFNARKH